MPKYVVKIDVEYEVEQDSEQDAIDYISEHIEDDVKNSMEVFEDIPDPDVETSVYEKGNKKFPTITLFWNENHSGGFTFGLTKAKLILQHYRAIKQFVADNDKTDNSEVQ